MEEWRSVAGYEGYYEVSSLGRIKSLNREVTYSDGRVYTYPEKVLRTTTARHGYKRVELKKQGQNRPAFVHRLVAEAFIPNPDNLPHVLHWDDTPDNNEVGNLRWGLPKDNSEDKIRNNGGHYNSLKTHCINGHEFNEENTKFYTRPSGVVGRKCMICKRESNAELLKKWKGEEPPEHGTTTGYYSYSCRCEECKQASSEYEAGKRSRSWERINQKKREYRERNKDKPFSEIPHGTNHGYNAYSCRCEACVEAAKQYRRDYQARKKRDVTDDAV